jgi:hypothetical protein
MMSYIKDEVGKEEDFACDALKARKGLIKDGKVLHFYMQLHNDLLKSNRLLLPGVDIKLELKKNSAGFPLITDVANNAKFKIEKLEVTLRKLTVEPMVVGAIESKLNETPAFYPIAHSKIRNHLLAANTKNIHIPNILRGKLPRGFVILFVSNDAHSGLSTKNPFIFKHYDLDFLNVYINGEPIHANGNRPVWGDGSIVKQYKWMLDNSIATDRDRSLIAGHYVFSTPMCKELKLEAGKELAKKGLDLEQHLKEQVKLSILRYFRNFRLMRTV